LPFGGWSSKTIITFSTRFPDLALPKREYLALHAACTEVTHLSGAAEAIEEFWTEWEDTPVLAPDGSSSKLLEDALMYQSLPISRVFLNASD
jgi:hypothetical protein